MGGNAFTTARRLTSAELSLLQSHCARSLAGAGLFGGQEDGIGTFVYFGDKVKHGDLDLVVGWDELEGSGEGGGVKWLKGKERGIIVDGEEMMLPTHNRMGAPYPRVRLDEASTDVLRSARAKLEDSKGNTNIDANAAPRDSAGDAAPTSSHAPVAQATEFAIAARLTLSAQAHAAHLKSLADNAFTDKLRDLCFDASRAIGAVEWVRYGYEVSTKIPCTVINPEVDEQEHYQVDLVLVPPSHHHFTVYYTSFGYALMLLAVGIRRISRSLTLHMTHLSLRHSPFFGLPYVDVELTKDAREFADWLGLDYARWFEGFANERELWEWMTDVSAGNNAETGVEADAGVNVEGANVGDTDERLERWIKQDPRTRKSPLAGAWRALAKSRKKEPTPHKAKKEGLDRFCDWLRTTKWAEPRAGEVSSLADTPASQSMVDGDKDATDNVTSKGVDKSEDNTQTASVSVEPPPRTPTNSTFHAIPPVPFLSPSQSSTTGTITSLDTETSNTSNPSAVDPENPSPLDFRATKTLRFWGKTAAYEAAVEERRGKARELTESQQRRERSRSEHRRRVELGIVGDSGLFRAGHPGSERSEQSQQTQQTQPTQHVGEGDEQVAVAVGEAGQAKAGAGTGTGAETGTKTGTGQETRGQVIIVQA